MEGAQDLKMWVILPVLDLAWPRKRIPLLQIFYKICVTVLLLPYPLSNAENFKFKKYNEPLSKLASLQHAKYNLYPFVFSLFGSLAPTALRFLDDFEMIVKRRTGRNFNRLFWQNRIVFSIFKGMLKMVSDALLSLGSHYERVASSVFVLGEMDFLDVDL
ncbi:hypothetical protein P9112_008428 [Eukaryota sp. TZLM1-RC]